MLAESIRHSPGARTAYASVAVHCRTNTACMEEHIPHALSNHGRSSAYSCVCNRPVFACFMRMSEGTSLDYEMLASAHAVMLASHVIATTPACARRNAPSPDTSHRTAMQPPCGTVSIATQAPERAAQLIHTD